MAQIIFDCKFTDAIKTAQKTQTIRSFRDDLKKGDTVELVERIVESECSCLSSESEYDRDGDVIHEDYCSFGTETFNPICNATITEIHHIKIHREGRLSVFLNCNYLTDKQIEALAVNDEFESEFSFTHRFDFPFEGNLIEWRILEDETTRFKVGKMVVHSEGIGIIKRYEPSLVLSPLFVKFEHCSLWIKPSEVKCVRKPRKGSKEARDIVAMLGWENHDSRLGLKQYFKEKGLKRTFKEINVFHVETARKVDRFKLAKSILKEDLWV